MGRVCEALRAVALAVDAGGEEEEEAVAKVPEGARAAVTEAVRAVPAFEGRVGAACGMEVGVVTTASGSAIELGNRNHVGFGAAHEEAAAEVARRLAAVLEAFGATRTFWFTMD
jgi:hypothetical protein